MALNSNLHDARRARKDEFYTQLGDIENELRHYKDHFAGRTVYCNCDDPTVSNFRRPDLVDLISSARIADILVC